jgi:hypothetical protein
VPYARTRTIYLALVVLALVAFAFITLRRDEQHFEIHGTVGKIPVFTGPSSIGDSATSEVAGALNLGIAGLRYNGPLAIGPASGSPSLLSGTTASIAVVQTTHTTLTGWVSVNLTGVPGIIDWAAADNSGAVPACSNANQPSKVDGAHALACGVRDVVQPSVDVTVQNGNCGGTCTYQITWTATDASTTYVSGNNGYHGVHSYNVSTNRYGMAFTATAGPSQLVLRQYLGAFAGFSVICTGTLTDSYGVARSSAATPSFNTATGSDTYFVNVWTYTGVQVGDQLRVVCLMAPDVNVSYGNSLYWFAETLAPT